MHLISYTFSYGVKGDYTGTDFSRQEKSDGNLVQRSYSVQLPDGRRQIVNYEANDHKAFVDNVNYERKVQYPFHGAPPVVFKPNTKYY